jgi:cytidylate kinase
LKQIADTLEATCIKKQADYEAAILAAHQATEALEAILLTDNLPEIRFSWTTYKNVINARIGVMHHTHKHEVEQKYLYLASEKQIAAACNKQREKLREINDCFSDE